MLIHEVPEGGWGMVDNHLFVRPPGCHAFRCPAEARPILEDDGTLSLMQPVKATHSSGFVVRCFLIHDQWHQVIADIAA